MFRYRYEGSETEFMLEWLNVATSRLLDLAGVEYVKWRIGRSWV